MQDGDSFYDEGSPAPPLLHHQFGEFGSASRTSSPPLFRSMYAGQEYGEYSGQEMVSEAYSDSGAYDEPPVYRSISRLFHEDTQTMVQGGGGGYGMGAVGACWGDPDAPVYTGDLGYLNPAEVVMAPAEFNFELPREIFDIVLSFLPSHPDLFMAMAVNRYWCEACQATYARRTVRVPAVPDALLQAVAAATPGDTLLLQPGTHELSRELLLEKPLRLGGIERADGVSPAVTTVLATRCPSLLRTRAVVKLHGLTFCRMGDAEGHPNAVIVAESATLTVERSRVTCGGTVANTVEQALQAFVGAPQEPGGAWQQLPPTLALFADDDGGATRQGPQSGVWVGSCATVTLRHNTIACCSGPGVKIYRGQLRAEHNTIAFSRCGANVVANSGRVSLTQNAIHGARGDGVSSWNNSHIALEQNTIHSNRGTGITINTGGGSVSIVSNRFFENTLTAVQFATSNVKKVTIGEGEQANDWERNAAGGLQGLAPRTSISAPGGLGLTALASSLPSPPGALPAGASPAGGSLPALPVPIPAGAAGSRPGGSSGHASHASHVSLGVAPSRTSSEGTRGRGTSDDAMDVDPPPGMGSGGAIDRGSLMSTASTRSVASTRSCELG